MCATLEPGHVTSEDGTGLRLWEQVPDDAEEAILFVHGSITCSRALFAPPVDDDESYSWLRATAESGRAAFALDIRGYGDSDRPAELDESPTANDPPVLAPTAAEDIAAAVDAVTERFGVVHLVGVSWGTMTCGYYCAEDDHGVTSLAQVAPVYDPPWSFDEITTALNVDPDLNAYYHQRYDEVKERQGGNEPLFEAIWETQVESNQGVDEDTYIAQAGALADTKRAVEGERPFDAAAIETPTLVVRGTADDISTRPDALALYDALDCEREYAELSGADHYAMHGDRRHTLYELVADYFDRV